ncbi:MAG: type II secretion system protein GspE, partial [Deltaproteobacteria bacterium]|nr:type II secretion system protein GspE [Deltaproteobacteria bacterium]
MTKHLSQILQDNFNISKEALDDAQRIKIEKGEKAGEILLRKKIITESQLLEALSIQYNIPFQPDLPMENIGQDIT